MSFKSLLKISRNFIFASIGLSIFSLVKTDPVKAGTCPAEGSTGAEGVQSADCNVTPEVMEIKFYELGFCTGDPLSGADFSNSTCEKSWESTSGETAELASFSYLGLTSGLTYKVPSKQYDYAYVIFDPTWGLKGKVYFNNDTYFTDSSGNVTTVDANYSKFSMKVNSLDGGGGCYEYSSSTDYGAVKARLTNTSLVSATNTSSCNAATRMVGSIDLNTPLVMTDDVKAYQLTWIIKDMGLLSVDNGFSDAPVGWGGGPFVPVFTLYK